MTTHQKLKDQNEYGVLDSAISVDMLKEGFTTNEFPDGISIVNRLLKHLDEGTTDLAESVFIEDPLCFSSQEQHNAEVKWFLKDILHPVAMSCELPKPGSFFTTEIMNIPILLTRDKNGKAHAFLNACLHRGAALKVEQCGSAGRLSCPYHGWSYNLDGSLFSIPAVNLFGDCDAKIGEKLTLLPIVEAAGILHIGLTPDTPKVFEAQKGLLDILAPLEFEKWELFDRRSWWTGKYNWKLGVGTFMETYHIQYLHPNTVTSYLHGGVVAVDNWGACSRMSIPALTIDHLRSLPEDQWNPADHLTIMFHHYPSTTITLQGYMISVVQMFPGGTPDTCQVQHSIYTPHKVTDENEIAFRTVFKDMLNYVLDSEDFMICETISKSSNAKALKKLYFGRNEPNLQIFHKAIREQMKIVTKK